MRDDVGGLLAVGGRVDGLEGEAVAETVDAGAGDDEGLGVRLVFDLSEVGGVVGVGELEGLEVVGVEAGAGDGEGKVVGCGSLFDGGCGRGGGEGQGGGEER